MKADSLVFFATDWGYKNGGVNAFNIDLCKAVARLLNPETKVYCVVPSSSTAQVSDASRAGVRLIETSTLECQGQRLTIEAVGSLKRQLRRRRSTWWIGHDLVTGPWAHEAYSHFGGLGVALIHHMDYDAYKDLQAATSHHAVTLIRSQNAVLSTANIVFAVGPKLLASARDKLRGHPAVEISELIPGLPHVEPLPQAERFRAITVGRFDPANDLIKQVRLATQSFGAAVGADSSAFGDDPSMTVMGTSEDDLAENQAELRAEVERHANKLVAIRARPYEEDREIVLDEIRRHSVLMMLSLHEGFGLAGWEAIGAAVPLIISTNSGAYDTIDRLFGGMGTGCIEGIDTLGSGETPYFHPDDLSATRRALLRIARRPVRAKENAITLRQLVAKFCSWEHTAADLCSSIGVATQKTSQVLNLERWTPTFLVDAIKARNTTVDSAARRKLQYQALWDGLKPPSRIQKFVLLFGGISTALSDKDAVRHYVDWLRKNDGAELFIAYQAGAGASARARTLNPTQLNCDGTDAPVDLKKHMAAKELRSRRLCESIDNKLAGLGGNARSRFHSAPLTESLTSYVIVMDDQLLVTPLMSGRSEETLSFMLARRAQQFPRDVIHYIIYNIEKSSPSQFSERALTYLRSLMQTGYTAE
ncbi:MAG TPA: hypothetical protein VK669_13540 [Candidatus Limnocylindrales bacterium]|nr:hypothetical protein [Candidatus Limnocylindrales bacterium]